jgi:hypothetical protein
MGGDQSKEKKNWGGPELKKKKIYSLNFFFFGIGGGPWPPPVPPVSKLVPSLHLHMTLNDFLL